jgi:hypothetical protein
MNRFGDAATLEGISLAIETVPYQLYTRDVNLYSSVKLLGFTASTYLKKTVTKHREI